MRRASAAFFVEDIQLQFEQSVSLINECGTALDKNVGQNSRQYHCTNG
jgi:hypothetical protein